MVGTTMPCGRADLGHSKNTEYGKICWENSGVKLLVQPGDSISDLVKGIDAAKKSIEILIFRFDRNEIERALENAAKRGVRVQALIAHTNRGGEAKLRKLETRLLAA